MSSKDIDKYIHDIKLLMPISTAESRRYLADVRSSIDNYLEQNSDAGIQDIYDEFGTPSDVAIDYIRSMDSNDLIRKLSSARMVRALIATVIIAVLLALAVFIGFRYKYYLDAKNSIITKEETIIEYGEDE